jgi:threonyl-tRNA synthetase
VYIEHVAGRFPVWLAPEQVRIIPINADEAVLAFAGKAAEEAKKLGVRVTIDFDNESVSKKIRAAELMKVPYALVIGQKEVASGEVIPRVRKDIEVNPDHAARTVEEFLRTVVNETKTKVIKTSL